MAIKINSPALKADAWHHRSDALSSIAAFIGIGGAIIGGVHQVIVVTGVHHIFNALEVELISSDSFNFCFRNSNNEWDNNNGENYIFPIEKIELALVVKEKTSLTAPRKLRKSYIWSKKVRLAVYKIITYLPKLISGYYKRKVSE